MSFEDQDADVASHMVAGAVMKHTVIVIINLVVLGLLLNGLIHLHAAADLTTPITTTLVDLPTAGVYGPVRIDIIETDKLCVFVSRMPGIGPANIQVMQKSGLLSPQGGCW